MPRIARCAVPYGFFHVTARGVAREPIFRDGIDYAEFRRQLVGVHRLNGRYAQRFNRRYDRVGHVFQNRFSSYVIESEDHLHRALAYVRANPVKAGLCTNADDWLWSGTLADSD